MKIGSSITIRTLFATNHQQFYKELDSDINIPNKAPHAQEDSEFCSKI